MPLFVPPEPISFPILAPDGTVSAPSYSWANDPDGGWYKISDGVFGFAVEGIHMFDVNSGGITMDVGGSIRLPGNAGGSVIIGTGGNSSWHVGPTTANGDLLSLAWRDSGGNNPALLQVQTDTGGGSERVIINGQLNVVNNVSVSSGSVLVADRAAGFPSWSWVNESNSGVYRAGAGDFRFSIGGVDTLQVVASGIRVLPPQMGIGTGSPAASAALDITSTTGALLVPRMTTAQKNALTAVNGMIVYDSTLNKFQGYENGAWTNFI